MDVETVVPDSARTVIIVALALAAVAVVTALFSYGRGKHLLLTLLGAVPRRSVRDVAQPLPRAERDWELVSRLDTRSMKRRSWFVKLLAPVGRGLRRLGAMAFRPVRVRVSAAIESARASRAEAKRAQDAAKAELKKTRDADEPKSKSDSQRNKAAASVSE